MMFFFFVVLFSILDDDDDDDDGSGQSNQSTTNGKNNREKSADDKLTNLPIRLLHRIQQLRNDNAKAEREVLVMKRKYHDLKRRCDAISGSFD